MDYLVSPPEATDWALAPEAFVALLLERWPRAAVREVPESAPTYAIDFTVLEPGRVDGSFARDGRMLGLSGEITDVMSFAAAVRAYRQDAG